MVWTTPTDKAKEHKKRHKFVRGGCIYCGWYCLDCPDYVATCKCIPKDSEDKAHNRFVSMHAYTDVCTLRYCRIHFAPEWGKHRAYPFSISILSSRFKWQLIMVHCGPGAYLPKRNSGL